MTPTPAAAVSEALSLPTNGPQRIPTLDGIRAVSFGIVFLANALVSTHLGTGIPGYFGLATFFFLSGYLITTLLRIELDRTEKIAFRDFYLRRVLRIFPPFYLILGLDCVLTLTHVLDNTLWPSAVLAQAFHLTNYWIVFHSHVPDAGWWYRLAPGSWIFWSLAVEEHFYLVFPLIYLLMRRRKMTPKQQMQALLGLCAAVLVWRCLLVFGFHVTKERTYVSSDTRVDSILFGCLLAVYGNPFLDAPTCSAERIKNFWVPVGVATLIVSFGMGRVWHDFDQTLRYTVQGAALIPIFIAAIRYPSWGVFRWLNVPWMRFVGLLSYSLYLLHTMVLYAIGHHTHWHAPLVGLASLAVSLGLATLIYHFVEKPCARIRKKLSHSGRVSGDPPSSSGTTPAFEGEVVPVGGNSQRVAKNVLATLATQLISWGLAFAVTLFLPRYVGAAGLGKLTFASSFITVFGVFIPLGTTTLMVKEIARDRSRTGELLPAALALRIPLAILMGGLAMGVVTLLGYPSQTRILVMVGAIAIFVMSINDAFSAALQGQENMPRQSVGVLVDKFLSSGLIIFLITRHAPLWALAAVSIWTCLASLMVNATAFRSLLPTLRLPRWVTIRTLALAGLPFMGWTVCQTMYGQADPIVLSLMTNDQTVGWYAVAFRLIGTTMFLPSALAMSMLPTLSRLHRENEAEFRSLARRMLSLVILCGVPISVVLLTLPGQLVEIIYPGHGFSHSSPVLRVGGVGVLLWFIGNALGTTIFAADGQAKMFKTSAFAVLLGVPACILGVLVMDRLEHNGAVGAMASDVLLEAFLVCAYIRLLPAGTFGGESLRFAGRCLFASLPMSAVLLYLIMQGWGLWSLIIAALTYLVSCTLMGCISSQDLRTLRQMLLRRQLSAPAPVLRVESVREPI